jgi:hypothetical protein
MGGEAGLQSMSAEHGAACYGGSRWAMRGELGRMLGIGRGGERTTKREGMRMRESDDVRDLIPSRWEWRWRASPRRDR